MPNRSRRAVVTALIGFHSATVRSPSGSPSAGTQALDNNGSGKAAPPSRSAEEEQRARIARLGSRTAGGACPRLAAAFTGDAGPIDTEAVFEEALRWVLNGFG